MLIALKKFGDILTSREAGREALLAFLPTLNSLDKNEEIIIDFQGVSVLTPSWADEFLRPIVFQDVIVFDELTDNKISSVGKTLQILTFPYTDEEALCILKNNNVQKISVHRVDALTDSRLEADLQQLP